MIKNTLIDSFGRPIEYLRLSVTDRCDLRCHYCLPKGFKGFIKVAEWLNFDEIETLVRAFIYLGISHVRLTGGEPLMRRDLPVLAHRLAVIPGLNDLSLSSNCTQMEAYAPALFQAGIRRLNVSLDSLQATVFREISGGDLAPVLCGIKAAQQAGFSPIRINTVVLPGINDKEVEKILEFCMMHGFTLRLIEKMPLGTVHTEYVDLQRIKQRLERRFHLIPEQLYGGGPAHYYRLAGTATCIGFITPLSQHFCTQCNRIRLAADGRLYLCLGHEHSVPLRPLLQLGLSAPALHTQLTKIIAYKPEGHLFHQAPRCTSRNMAMTGG